MQNNPERPNANNAAYQPDADYGEYTNRAPSGQHRASASKRPANRKKKGGNNLLKPILAIVGIIAVIVLIIVAVVALFSGPKKGVKIEDNAYYAYTDSDGKYYIVSNGKKVEQSFEGEVTLIPAKNQAFAYVFEKVSDTTKSGIRMYILKGNKLEAIEGLADSIPTIYSDYTPAFIYLQKGDYQYFIKDDQTAIVRKAIGADNFVMSADGSTVVYTQPSSMDPNVTTLMYFHNGGADPVGPANFTPVALSSDGTYVYGTGTSAETGLVSLYYLKINKNSVEAEEPVTISSAAKFGSFRSITAMNAKGTEIVFTVDDYSKGAIVSYVYKINDSEPTILGDGTFTLADNFDKTVVAPDTLMNSCFICVNDAPATSEDAVNYSPISTYVLKKGTAYKLANTLGQFSPDKKYFYYIDEMSNLVRVPLNSKDFGRDEENVINSVTDFAVIEKGDVYAMLSTQDIMFWDASTGKRVRSLYNADKGSMKICGNTMFASVTDSEAGTTLVYSSTAGSTKQEANFKDTDLAQTPTVIMGGGTTGYALVKDTNGSFRLYYTSNGKSFSFVTSCDGSSVNTETLPPKETESEEE